MSVYIALFRGINVGGNNLLPMKALVALLEDLGCQDVRTYIQSGNAVFRAKTSAAKKLTQQIRASVQRDHGFTPEILLLEAAALRTAIENNAFPTEDGKALHLFFLASPPKSPDLAALELLKAGSEEFALVGSVFYFYTNEGVGRSKLAARVERALGVPATARNWNTVRKLAEMAVQAS